MTLSFPRVRSWHKWADARRLLSYRDILGNKSAPTSPAVVGDSLTRRIILAVIVIFGPSTSPLTAFSKPPPNKGKISPDPTNEKYSRDNPPRSPSRHWPKRYQTPHAG